jgi:hypothetical protein
MLLFRLPLMSLVNERYQFENGLLDPKFRLLRAVFAALNERVARIQFKRTIDNQAKFLGNLPAQTVEIDTRMDAPEYFYHKGQRDIFTSLLSNSSHSLSGKPHS